MHTVLDDDEQQQPLEQQHKQRLYIQPNTTPNTNPSKNPHAKPKRLPFTVASNPGNTDAHSLIIGIAYCHFIAAKANNIITTPLKTPSEIPKAHALKRLHPHLQFI